MADLCRRALGRASINMEARANGLNRKAMSAKTPQPSPKSESQKNARHLRAEI
jgi:hypothetical protein